MAPHGGSDQGHKPVGARKLSKAATQLLLQAIAAEVLEVLVGGEVARLRPLLPKKRGVKRVDDRKVLRGIIHGTRSGLPWADAPAADGSHKTLYSHCPRWSDKGVSDLVLSELPASDAPEPEVLISH